MSLPELTGYASAVVIILAQIGIAVGVAALDRRIDRLEERHRVSEAAHAAVSQSLFPPKETSNV